MNVTARIILVLVLGASLCAACQQSATPSPTSPTPTSRPTAAPQLDPDIEEYTVYTALLESSFTGEYTKQILIMDHTRVPNPGLVEQNLTDFQEGFPLDEELINSFKEQNQQPYLLEPVLELKWEYQLLSQEEVDEFRPQDEASGWQLFYEKYPGGVGFIYLSRVGFNADLSQALVYYEHYHYDQPILGGYYFMTRQEGGWVKEYGYEWMT